MDAAGRVQSIPRGLKPKYYAALAARLNRLRKNSVFCAVLKGHDFGRAAKRLKINVGFSP
jgi:hypothetical protein